MKNSNHRDISNYQEEYNNHSFENIMVKYRRKCVLEQIHKYNIKNILEVGCGNEPIMKYFSDYDNMYVVEPGDEFFNNAIFFKNENKNKNIECHQGLIENLIDKLNKVQFDFIIISSLLHELKNNLDILKKIRELCNSETLVHINVPNKKSLHRLLAYHSGIIPSLDERSNTQIRLQQNEFFDLNELNNFIKKAGFYAIDKGSYFVKPFTHGQMSNLLDNGIIDDAILDGFYNLTEEFPENGSEIYVNVKIA